MIKEIQFSGIENVDASNIKDFGKCNLIIPQSYDEWMHIELWIVSILDGLYLYKTTEDSLIDCMHDSFGDACCFDEHEDGNIMSSSKIIFNDDSYIKVDFGEYTVKNVNTSEKIRQKEYLLREVERCPSDGIYIANMINDHSLSPEEEYKYINDLIKRIDDYEQIFIISYSYIALYTLYLYTINNPEIIKIISKHKDEYRTDWLDYGFVDNLITNMLRKLYEKEIDMELG